METNYTFKRNLDGRILSGYVEQNDPTSRYTFVSPDRYALTRKGLDRKLRRELKAFQRGHRMINFR